MTESPFNEEQTYRQSTQDKLNMILEQVKKTNGRVSSLENWKWSFVGGWIVLTAIVVPIVAAYVTSGRL